MSYFCLIVSSHCCMIWLMDVSSIKLIWGAIDASLSYCTLVVSSCWVANSSYCNLMMVSSYLVFCFWSYRICQAEVATLDSSVWIISRSGTCSYEKSFRDRSSSRFTSWRVDASWFWSSLFSLVRWWIVCSLAMMSCYSRWTSLSII